MLPLGGLARNSDADIDAQFPEEGIKVAASMQAHAFVLSTTATTGTFADAMHVLTAYVTEPGFRGVDTSLPTLWSASLRTARGLPAVVAQESLLDAVAPGNPVTLKAAESAPLKGADVIRVLKPILTGSPLELTIVGDADEKSVTEVAAATIGALPLRRAIPAARPDAWFLRFPEHPPALVTATHEGPPEKALVEMVRPLWVADLSRRQEEHALLLAARVMSDALLRQIRGEMGKAYSPAAATAMPDHADQGYLVAETEVAAADIDVVRAQMSAVAAKIAKGDFTDQDVENARKPYLAALAKRFATDDFWAGVLSGSSVDDSAVREMPGYQSALAAITPAEVRKAAAAWLSAPPIVVVVTGRAPTPAKQGPQP
jgi:zinc protease